jgi:hypothetical protein
MALSKAGFFDADPVKSHPVTLIAKFGGVDMGKMRKYYESHPEQVGNFCVGWPHKAFHSFRIEDELKNVDLPEQYRYLRDIFIIYHETVHTGELMINMTGEINVDGTDAKALSSAQTSARLKLHDCLDIFRKYMPGCKDAYVLTTASSIGVRESRQLDGRYTITLDDITRRRVHEDTIGCGKSLLGSHASNGKHCEFDSLPPGTFFTLPYRCMLPKKLEGLLVAGRCISVTREAMGATRTIPVCFVLGQAAGTAAAICARDGIYPSALHYESLKVSLTSQGVFLG